MTTVRQQESEDERAQRRAESLARFHALLATEEQIIQDFAATAPARHEFFLRATEWLMGKVQSQQAGNAKRKAAPTLRWADEAEALAKAAGRHSAGETWEEIATTGGGEALRKKVERARKAGVPLPAPRRKPRG
jgi:hypothetical protein